MTKIRVFAKRPTPLEDLNIVTINDFNTEFTVDLGQQLDDKPEEIVHTQTFTPSTGPITPVCLNHSTWDGEKCVCDAGYHDENGVCVADAIEPPLGDKVLYDSNKMGGWDNGKARTVAKSEGDIKPDGKGLFTAASGNPRFEIDGKGVGRLKCGAGHGRIYIKAINYNSVLEMDFNIENSAVDNLSLKLRSRHQEGGANGNRAGGEGWSIDTKGWDSKRESFHNSHSSNGKGNLSKPLKNGEWYKCRFTCKDEGDNKKQIRLIGEIDYGDGKWVKEMDLVDKSPEAYFFDKELLGKDCYLWIRSNNSGNGSIALRNVTLRAL
jgi:hypothetical protein